jgi:hypothetical protein
MPTVSVNAPKTPVTQGSNSIAMATIPNICKMPGPPAPFVPTPLPNIGKSAMNPQGYSTSVTFDGNAVAIQGASFDSMGDIASKALGGGIVSMNCTGPTKFVGPGSFDVQIEGKNVQLLSDPMLNNNGPSGSPPNAATMVGVVHAGAAKLTPLEAELVEIAKKCQKEVEKENKELKKAKKKGMSCTARGTAKHACCKRTIDEKGGKSPFKNVAAECSHEKAPGCRLDVAVLSGPPPMEPGNVAKIYDFKFNCPPNKPHMSKAQEDKYLDNFPKITEVAIVHPF